METLKARYLTELAELRKMLSRPLPSTDWIAELY